MYFFIAIILLFLVNHMLNRQPFNIFIIIDDDPINNFICRQVIEASVKDPVQVLDFTIPEQALAYISTQYNAYKKNMKTVLFLDVNTATLSAWEFLERFATLKKQVKNMFSIYIISSSVDEGDREKALSNGYVKGFLVKPITIDSLHKII
jgi:response regulator RpfG family c-di-GMP phosphodiesterase